MPASRGGCLTAGYGGDNEREANGRLWTTARKRIKSTSGGERESSLEE